MIAITAILILAILIESQTKVLHRFIDGALYDNVNHYLPCSQLPDQATVNQAVSEHRDTLDAILAVHPDAVGAVGYEIDVATCPGKADLIIWYASHQDRLAIQEILPDDTFYGIPLRLQNR